MKLRKLLRMFRVEAWEQNHINALTLKILFAATIATGATTAVAFFLRSAGFPEIHPELLFMPWGVAVVIGVFISFHSGVREERSRAAREDKEKRK